MVTNRFKIGDRVEKWAGVRLNGRVIAPIYWKGCNDGTYKAPDPGDVCIEWDDGTKGYCKPQWLKKIEHVTVSPPTPDDTAHELLPGGNFRKMPTMTDDEDWGTNE